MTRPSGSGGFLSELRRRKVVRAGAVYLVAAWAAIEVADTVFPNLGLPPWTVTFVIILAALGLPITLALAWVFDLTTRGFRRTDGGHRIPRALLPVAAVLVAALGLWVGFRPDAGPAADPDLVVVAPFRVAGAAPDLAYLREGLMDLIAASLTGADGREAATPARTVSHLLRDQLGPGADPQVEDLQVVARQLGAGTIVVGEVVGSEAEVAVRVAVHDAATGARRESFRMEHDPEDLHGLVDALVSRLIAAREGIPGERLAALTTSSREALRSYLDGERAAREGRHVEAVRSFDRAFELDSTFLLAAFGLVRAAGWAAVPLQNHDRAVRMAWSRRADLAPGDRLLLEASRPGYPDGATSLEILRQLEAAVERAPHSIELRYLLGDAYMHHGPAVGMTPEEGYERGYDEFERVLRYDSTYIEPLIHAHEVALDRRDTAAVVRWGRLIRAVGPGSPRATSADYFDWLVGAGPPLDLDTVSPPHLLALVQTTVAPVSDVHERVLAAWRTLTAAEDKRRIGMMTLHLGLHTGRPSIVSDVLRDRALAYPDPDIPELALALFWSRDARAADRAAEAVARRLEADPLLPATPTLPAVTRSCLLAHHQAGQPTAATADLVADLATVAAAGGDGPTATTARVCAQILEAGEAVRRGDADAADRVERVDLILSEGPQLHPFYMAAANPLVAGLWMELNRPERALAAATRRRLLPGDASLHVDATLLVARLAEAVGQLDLARRSYALYVAWREGAEPLFQAEVAEARRRIAALSGDS